MTISVLQSNDADVQNAAAAQVATPGDVAVGSLIEVTAWRWAQAVTENLVAGDCTQAAGTATIGAVQMDVHQQGENAGENFNIAIFSAIVTGAGSLTMQVAGNAGDYWGITVRELDADAGGWGANRLEDFNSVAGPTSPVNNTPSSGDATSAGEAIFVGVCALDTLATTITPDGAFTEIAEIEGGGGQPGASMYRIADSGGLTDAATWTLGNNMFWIAAVAVYREEEGGATEVTGSGTPAAQSAATAGVSERELPGSGTPASPAATAAGTGERELPGSGTPASQAASVAGAAERELLCSGSLASADSTAAGTAVLQVKLLLTAANGRELRDEAGALVANLADIAYEWYDKDTDTEGNPVDSGTFSTDANGEATIQLANSTLAAGQFGLLVLAHPSDDTIRGIYRIPVT